MNVLILNSAQGKYPVAVDPWVVKTTEAVSVLASDGHTIIAGTQPIMWDFCAWRAAVEDARTCFLMFSDQYETASPDFGAVFDEYGFTPERTECIAVPGIGDRPVKEAWPLRDRYAIEMADVVFPVSIRRNGKLYELLQQLPQKRICRDFMIDWEVSRHVPVYDFEGLDVNPLPSGEWVIHWTRASQGPWPDEPWREFFTDFFARPKQYVRTAVDTLTRIVADRVILGTSAHMPGSVRAVSCSSLSPDEAIGLMRWRKRYVRYSFEPFGIAIRKTAFEKLGGREVVYCGKEMAPEDADPLFFQSPGEIGDWEKEHEWRLKGDLRLDDLDRDDLFVIVPGDKEYDFLKDVCHDIGIHRLFGGE